MSQRLVVVDDDFEKLFDAAMQKGFIPTGAFELDSNRCGQPTHLPKDLDVETARRFWEIRWKHPDGNTLRMFPKGGDGRAHLIEYD